MKLSPSDITIGSRYRKDVDTGIKALCDSIADVGQLQPIVIDAEYNLIVGERRLRACELLGIDVDCVITTSLDDAAKRIRAERDENGCRLPWTPEEECDIAESLLKVAKQEAAERMAATQPKEGQRVGSQGSVNLTDPTKGEAIEVVAAALGKSKNTLKKQMEVVATARDASQPEHVREVARDAVQHMNATGKVDGAHKLVTAAKASSPSPQKWQQGATLLPPVDSSKPALHESDTLFQIKRLWRRASKHDRRAFDEWRTGHEK